MGPGSVVVALLWVVAGVTCSGDGSRSLVRLAEGGSFDAERAARGDTYLDLLWVRPKGRNAVVLHGELDGASKEALAVYGSTLKSAQIHLNSKGAYAVGLAKEASTGACVGNATRAYTLHPWTWHNAWHFWNDMTSLGNRVARTLRDGDVAALFLFGGVPAGAGRFTVPST